MRVDWDAIVRHTGEIARPVVLLLSGIALFIGTILPSVDAIKLGVVGTALGALFAVKGQDKREEIRASVAMATATTKTTETAASPAVVSKTTETTQPKPEAKP